MKLVDITPKNWNKVLWLTTNADGAHTIEEEFVASNAYSLVQAAYGEPGWVVKAIEHDGAPIGFAMYGHPPDDPGITELCRFMIDRRYQGKGLGKAALALIVKTMKAQYGCDKIYLTTEPTNARGKHVYEGFGFRATGERWDGEDVFCLTID